MRPPLPNVLNGRGKKELHIHSFLVRGDVPPRFGLTSGRSTECLVSLWPRVKLNLHEQRGWRAWEASKKSMETAYWQGYEVTWDVISGGNWEILGTWDHLRPVGIYDVPVADSWFSDVAFSDVILCWKKNNCCLLFKCLFITTYIVMKQLISNLCCWGQGKCVSWNTGWTMRSDLEEQKGGYSKANLQLEVFVLWQK